MTDLAERTPEAPPVVRSEPPIYRPDGQFSFFTDFARSTLAHDPESRQRLLRHREETAREQRVNPNTGLGTMGEFAPPGWLIDKWAGPSRSNPTFADLIPTLPLPAGVQSINIPKMTTGLLDQVQPAQGQAEAEQDPVTIANSQTVVTIAGDVDVSMQLYEQTPANPGFDAVTFFDLQASYDDTLEAQLFSGSGTNGQLLGLDNIVGKSTIDGSTVPAAVSGASNMITTLWPLLGVAAAAVGNNRKQPAEAVLMAPRRWASMAFSLDQQSRPIASPTSEAHSSDLAQAGGYSPVGRVGGLKVYKAGAIPAGAAADSIYFIRPSDMFLFESAPKLMIAQEALAGTLQVRLRLYKYVAFIGNRYPNGIAIINNLVRPTGPGATTF